MQPSPSILLYGREPNLLQSRRWVFEVGGFQVSSAKNLDEARQIASRQPFDLLVLCHTLSQGECRDARAWARTLPDMKRLMLVARRASGAELANEAVVGQFAGPRELVAVAHRVLASRMAATASTGFAERSGAGQLTGPERG